MADEVDQGDADGDALTPIRHATLSDSCRRHGFEVTPDHGTRQVPDSRTHALEVARPRPFAAAVVTLMSCATPLDVAGSETAQKSFIVFAMRMNMRLANKVRGRPRPPVLRLL